MNKEELSKLYDMDLNKLVSMAENITKENFPNKDIEVCSIISAKTGKCGENCKYCSQSIHNHTNIVCHPLLSVEEVKNAALKAKENGATRFCIVTSGRSESGEDFEKILEMIKAVASIDGIHCCASLGLLTEEQIIKIKEAGVERFNHNINTSKNYHNFICSTHNFEDRTHTVNLLTKHGIEACTGVILGMGETKEDRIDMAISLAQLNPTTVPINVLDPIKGTPLEDYKDKISEEDVIRTICIFRIAMPKAILRYAGGRKKRLSKDTQKLGLRAGVNGMLCGNYLTTNGMEIKEDKELIESYKKVC
ncbi:MAG: biotin synthase BioB [Bdellovibrionota bacterium]|nr:biotin synthase BioB [Pseudomonadota bacterium]MDY6090633.1 biotin synthase BioB [Bdellovibrionota bacterium]